MATKKQMRVSKAVDALGLPTMFLVECMADAEAKPHLVGQIDFHSYQHSSGSRICIASFENEILAFTESEGQSGAWLRMGSSETLGVADVNRLWNYLQGSEDDISPR